MFKASIMYPYAEGARFDFEYWTEKHLPWVKGLLGDALTDLVAEHGLAGGGPDAPPPFIACGHLYFESIEVFQAARAPHAQAIDDDIKNFTDVRPVLMISQILEIS